MPSSKLCSVEDCGRQHRARGYCLLHLRRVSRGAPLEGERVKLKAKVSPTTRDLEWAAGFIEGEGSITCGNRSENISASQVDTEALARLKKIFGGTVSLKEEAKGNRQMSFVWHASGARARGIMLTLFPLLSERRQAQILRALDTKGAMVYVQGATS